MSQAVQPKPVDQDTEPAIIDWHDHIHVDPAILAGKPVVKGTRMGVEFLLRLFAVGWTEEAVLESYPHLTRENLRAVFALAAEIVGEEWWSVLPAREQ